MPISVPWTTLLVQARPLHWAKNLIVMVPLLTSLQFFSLALWPAVLLAFGSLCLAATAGYQLNDIIDLEADRRHSQKIARPLAAGRLSIRAVLGFGTVLAATSLMLAFAVNRPLGLVVGGYLALSALYSAVLKRLVVIDVLALAAIYCARIFAGAAAISVIVSPYLLAFCWFFFLSLALMKRYIALNGDETGPAPPTYGRRDATVLLTSGVGVALASLALLALYIVDVQVRARYSSPDMLWGVGLVLLYVALRGWFMAARGRLDEDLASAAVRDYSLWIAGGLIIVFFLIAY